MCIRIFSGADDNCRSAVVGSGCISCRYCALRCHIGKQSRKLLQTFQGALGTRLFVLVKYGHATLSVLDFNGKTLVVKRMLLFCLLPFLLGALCPFILHFTGNAVLQSNLAAVAGHVHVILRAPESVMYHGIDHLEVEHSVTPANILRKVRRIGHGFHTAGNDNRIVSCLDGLYAQCDCLQSRTANLVDG